MALVEVRRRNLVIIRGSRVVAGEFRISLGQNGEEAWCDERENGT